MTQLVHGYDELRIRIEPGQPGAYRVLASTRTAEASGRFELPFAELEVENFILKVSRPRGRRRAHGSALSEARAFGGPLFKALFRDQIYTLYHDAITNARGANRGVRITLCLSGSPELIDIPWEYLFDDPQFLALSMYTPVVRYLDLPRAHRPLLVQPPLRLLGIVSSPAEYEQLDVDRERTNLERALAGLIDAGTVKLQWLPTPSLGALLRILQAQTFHALHYIGHGAFDHHTDQGVLRFADEGGWSQSVTGDKLGLILHDFSSLRLVVLNACEGARTSRTDPFTGVAGSLVQRDIPAVVAMQFEISDEAAIVFANGFYERLAAGFPVDASLSAARLAMLAERSDDIEWGTPVLFMREASGQIFDLGDGSGQSGRDISRLASPTPSRGEATEEHPRLQEAEVERHEHPSLQEAEVRRHAPERAKPLDADASTPQERQARLTADRSGQTYLIYRDGEGHQVIQLLAPTTATVTIGRDDTSDITLDWDGEVSRVHAELRVVGRHWTVRDDGLSKNGTFVNGERLYGVRRLKNGDVLAVGHTELVVRSPDQSGSYATRPSRTD